MAYAILLLVCLFFDGLKFEFTYNQTIKGKEQQLAALYFYKD